MIMFTALPASNNASSEVSPQFWSKLSKTHFISRLEIGLAVIFMFYLETAGQLISKRATSFCMMFGKPPYPSLRVIA